MIATLDMGDDGNENTCKHLVKGFGQATISSDEMMEFPMLSEVAQIRDQAAGGQHRKTWHGRALVNVSWERIVKRVKRSDGLYSISRIFNVSASFSCFVHKAGPRDTDDGPEQATVVSFCRDDEQ